jgi:mycoredoxin
MSLRKTFFILLVALVVYKWDVIRNEFSPPPDFSAQHPEGVVLYATELCGYCKKTREFFKQHNIAYVEYDIEKSEEGRQQYDQLRGSGIPLIMIRGQLLRGYDPNALRRALQIQ